MLKKIITVIVLTTFFQTMIFAQSAKDEAADRINFEADDA